MKPFTAKDRNALVSAMIDFQLSLEKFKANLPKITKERQEAEKNRLPRDPIADAW